MDIEITSLFNHDDHMDFSASRAELGENAAQVTWNNAVDAHQEINLLQNEDEKQAAREHFAEFGAWDEEEINGWSDAELNALFIQLVSGDIREAVSLTNSDPSEFDWRGYYELSEAGQVSGNMYEDEGKVYYTISA